MSMSSCPIIGATNPVARISSSEPNPKTLGAIVGQYKSRVTKQINHLRETPGGPIWQRNYYDRIIRNDKELQAIRKYIADNPLQWEDDHGKGVHYLI
jgi:REP element-mobilizing transposase RayT